MSKLKTKFTKKVMEEGIRYIEKNPVDNFEKLINWSEKLMVRDDFKSKHDWFKKTWKEDDNNWKIFIERVLTELHPNVRTKFLNNYICNSGLYGMPKAEEIRNKYDINVPWAILMDLTTLCNLKCTGCWAAEYDKKVSMEDETLDRIISEGKELGIYMYIYSGGEPLMRKNSIIKLAKKHSDCMFLAFSNATLVDEEFAQKLQNVGNVMLALSIEGKGEATDMRRGKGVYDKVINAMDILKKYGIGFGFSTCYHHYNYKEVIDEEYIRMLIDKGSMFGWYFTYIPIGKDASVDLLAKPSEREYIYNELRRVRNENPIFLMDFWNDGEYVDGCIAGGRRYFHINANGDVEPCAFIHYSNVNIKDVSLLEALKCPLFKAYRNNQPFNKNMLRPCPLLDNPEKLREMVNKTNAYSTQPIDEESVEDLTDKTNVISEQWAKTADVLWDKSENKKKKNKKCS